MRDAGAKHKVDGKFRQSRRLSGQERPIYVDDGFFRPIYVDDGIFRLPCVVLLRHAWLLKLCSYNDFKQKVSIVKCSCFRNIKLDKTTCVSRAQIIYV
jgi:hypothetical protein